MKKLVCGLMLLSVVLFFVTFFKTRNVPHEPRFLQSFQNKSSFMQDSFLLLNRDQTKRQGEINFTILCCLYTINTLRSNSALSLQNKLITTNQRKILNTTQIEPPNPPTHIWFFSFFISPSYFPHQINCTANKISNTMKNQQIHLEYNQCSKCNHNCSKSTHPIFGNPSSGTFVSCIGVI